MRNALEVADVLTMPGNWILVASAADVAIGFTLALSGS